MPEDEKKWCEDCCVYVPELFSHTDLDGTRLLCQRCWGWAETEEAYLNDRYEEEGS